MRMGAGLEYLSKEAMLAAGRNDRRGGRYSKAFNAGLAKYPQYQGPPLAEKCTRAALLNIMENRAAVEEWRDNELTEDQRIAWNHPVIIWRHWKARSKPKPQPRTNKYEEEIQRLKKKLQEAEENLKRSAHYANGIDLTKMAKILGKMGSDQDGEALNAAKMAEKMRRASGVTWGQVLGGATPPRPNRRARWQRIIEVCR
jgi:hypothetical protein